MRLVLIDGHALAYRAFHALPLEGFATRDGEPTNATYGFTSTLLHILQELRPDYIAVCFDAGHSGRDEIYPDYKAHRDRMPDEMRVQMDRIRQIVQAFGIPIFEVPGVEADDLMGALARQAASQGLETVIVTGDKDLLQLVAPGVKVFLAGRRLSDGTLYDEEAVRARYGGLSPVQLRDFKALVGDKSDNIPGVNGVGEKTATELLRKYGSLEEIYRHLDEVTPPRYREALEKNRGTAFLSQQLATIRTDLPVRLNLEECTIRNYDRARVTELFRRLEFRSLLDRLPASVRSEPPFVVSHEAKRSGVHGEPRSDAERRPEEPPSRPTQLPLFEVPEPKRPARRAVPTVPHIVREPEELAVLVERLSRAPAVTFDTETTSEDPMRADLVGLAFTDREGEGWYIPVGHRRGRQLPLERVLEAVRPLLEDPRLPKQAHHAKYDMTVLARHGIRVRGLAFDTMIAEWLCDPASHNLGLKSLAFIRLGVEMTNIQNLIGSGRKQVTMAEVEIEDAAAYAAADVDMTHRLVRVLAPELRQKGHWDLFVEMELPLVEVLMEMEMTGVALDTDFLARMSAELGARMAELEERIQGMVGMPFNINSGPQLAEVLFGVLKLPTKGVPRTSTGRYSLTAEVLDSLRGAHPIVDLVLEHRELAKLKSTYVDALPVLVNPVTGRLHTSYHQTGTVTGRISSSDPNLQNIPIRSPLGRQVRRAFVARPGWVLLGADYSQIELRILAHVSGDPGLTAAFQRGEDIHASTAAAILDIPVHQVTEEQRRLAKCVAADTLVATEQGLRPIQSLGNPCTPGEFTLIPPTLVATDNGTATATHLYFGGIQPVREITVKGGLSFACTPQHRLRVITPEGQYVWKYAHDIQIGDYLAIRKGTRVFGKEECLPPVEFPESLWRTNFKDVAIPDRWSPELARFFGYLLSEGYIWHHPTKQHTAGVIISQSLQKGEVAQDIERVCRALWGERTRIYKRKGNQFVVLFSSKIWFWLNALGLAGKADQKTIPPFILQAPYQFQVEFLRALFTGNGAFKGGRQITYSTKSPHLARNLQQMLLNLGYFFSLRAERRRDQPGQTYYTLKLTDRMEIERFLDEIGFASLEAYQKGRFYTDRLIIPFQRPCVQALYPLLRGKVREKAYEIIRDNQSLKLNRARARMILQQVGEDAHPALQLWKQILEHDLIFLPVVQIQGREAPVFDLSVPEGHTYIANGFVSHNSVNFGLIYGMSALGLARQTGLTLEEAENFISHYFQRFPKVREYLERTLAQAKNQGYVETLLGRRRYFPVLQSASPAQEQARRRAEREAVNAPIQGSAADIIKRAMLNLHRALHERGLSARMILQVHDELVLEVPQEELPTVTALVREMMESAYPLRVPLKVDLSVGTNWGEMQ